jgi:hypothetical protein
MTRHNQYFVLLLVFWVIFAGFAYALEAPSNVTLLAAVVFMIFVIFGEFVEEPDHDEDFQGRSDMSNNPEVNVALLQKEVEAWRERFKSHVYRPQDDCVAMKFPSREDLIPESGKEGYKQSTEVSMDSANKKLLGEVTSSTRDSSGVIPVVSWVHSPTSGLVECPIPVGTKLYSLD